MTDGRDGWSAYLVFVALLAVTHAAQSAGDARRRPSFIFILTDDQDYVLGSTDARWMPSLDKYLRKQGLELPHFVTSIASCCPSRTSFLTGRYCHNTNITSNGPERGSATKFMADQLDRDYLPVWLQSAGYSTYLVGKFLNGFKEPQAQRGCPRGWTSISPLIQDVDTEKGGEEAPRAPTYMENCDGVLTSYPGKFQEDVIRAKALNYIDDAAARAAPFFLMISTVAPHDAKGPGAYPQVPTAYQKLFPGVRAPRTGNWGRPVPMTVGFSKANPNDFNETDIDGRYRARLQSLRAVDDTIDAVMRRLACHGLSDDTVVMFTSDNGFKLGNHNIPREKFTYFEEDVRVPLLMAGPGVPRGVYAAEVAAAMTDLTATIVHMAGAATVNIDIDGAPLPLDLIAAAFPAPNQPGASLVADPPLCAGDLTPSAPREHPPPPRPPIRRPRPPSPRPLRPSPRPSQRSGSYVRKPSPKPRPQSNAGRRLRTESAGARRRKQQGTHGRQEVQQQGTTQHEQGAQLLREVAPPDGSRSPQAGAASALGFTEWDPVRELRAGLGGLTRSVVAAAGLQRARLLAGGGEAPYYGKWSNIQLVEAWLDIEMGNLKGKDYRVLRACTTFHAFGAPTEPRNGGHTCYKYIVLCNPRNLADLGPIRQLFDLGRDPVEMVDKFTQYKQPFPAPMKRFVDRLDAVLTVMSYCSGATCRNPFIVIHPDGGVTNLAQAMDEQYDTLYGSYAKLSYKRCAIYYHPRNEVADLRLAPTSLHGWLADEKIS